MTTPLVRSVACAEGRDIVVGIGELAVGGRDDLLVTYALGSCLGITLYDPVAGVGGMLHAMLPTSSLDPRRAAQTPGLFVDTGVPALFRACYGAGAVKQRIVVRVAGGGRAAVDGEDQFQIGKRNILTLRKLLWKNAVLVQAEDVGGENLSRSLALHVATGTLRLRRNGDDLFL